MLSASSQCGGRSPLSPLTQTTLEKHLPGLPTKRFLQQNKVFKVDVGCITGTNSVHEMRRLNFIFCFYSFALSRIQLNHVPSENWHKHMRCHQCLVRSLVFVFVCFFLGAVLMWQNTINFNFLDANPNKRHFDAEHIWHTEFAEYSRICLCCQKTKCKNREEKFVSV